MTTTAPAIDYSSALVTLDDRRFGRRRQPAIGRGPVLAKLLEPFRFLELAPEIPGDIGLRLARRGEHAIEMAEQDAIEVARLVARERGILSVENRVAQAAVRHDGVDQRRDQRRILL